MGKTVPSSHTLPKGEKRKYSGSKKWGEERLEGREKKREKKRFIERGEDFQTEKARKGYRGRTAPKQKKKEEVNPLCHFDHLGSFVAHLRVQAHLGMLKRIYYFLSKSDNVLESIFSQIL